MKLAEALLLRSDYQKRIENLQQRIFYNLKVQENEKPLEEPNALMTEVMKLNDELCALIKKINNKNNEVKLDNEQPLAEALADRDMLMKKRQLLSAVAANAAQKDHRLTHAEVKMYSTVEVAKMQKDIDSLSQQFRQLDTQIQGLNWNVDID